MYCHHRHTSCADTDRFCYACGMSLYQHPKRGSRLIPFLLLVLLSAAGLILFMMTSGQNAPVHAEGSSPWFYVRGGVLYFEPQHYTGSSELTVPSQIAGETVFSLSENCFSGCEILTTVYLPDTLTSIGDGAFSECYSLRGIYIPSSVRSIGKNAFYGCSALEAIGLHSTVQHIQRGAFDLCSRLNYIYFRGTGDQWISLYDAFINPEVQVFCDDGSFFQSENTIH